MDIALSVAAFLLSIVGIVGCIVPALPGVVLSYAGLLCAYFTSYSSMSPAAIWLWLAITVAVSVAAVSYTHLAAGACSRTQQQETAGEEAAEQHNIVYGINADNYRTETGEVGSGETLGKILNGFGVSALTIDRLDKASKDIFPLRNIRAGHKYTAFIHEDSLYAPHLDYLVYERNVAEYVVFGFHDDSVSVRTGEKQFTVRRTKKSATINSSLWGAIMELSLIHI